VSDEKENPLELEQIAEWTELYWTFNLPLQLWKREDGTTQVLNYMPRRKRCENLEENVSPADLPAFTRNAAKIFRNLATLMEAYGRGEIGHVYYPDKTLEEAKKDYVEELAEKQA
jgi:hypothetical protein